jgi:hypothetical protein
MDFVHPLAHIDGNSIRPRTADGASISLVVLKLLDTLNSRAAAMRIRDHGGTY